MDLIERYCETYEIQMSVYNKIRKKILEGTGQVDSCCMYYGF